MERGKKMRCKKAKNIFHISIPSLFSVRHSLKMQFKSFTRAYLRIQSSYSRNWKLRRKVSLGVEFSLRKQHQLRQQQQHHGARGKMGKVKSDFPFSVIISLSECSWLHEIAFSEINLFHFCMKDAHRRRQSPAHLTSRMGERCRVSFDALRVIVDNGRFSHFQLIFVKSSLCFHAMILCARKPKSVKAITMLTLNIVRWNEDKSFPSSIFYHLCQFSGYSASSCP